MSVTLVFRSTGVSPGSLGPVTMQGPSLTVGRGDENDLVLPDPDRMISKRHFVIEDRADAFVVVDLSTNGTFLNYAKNALGNTPTPISDGDVLSLGGYELAVEMAPDTASQGPVGGLDIPPPLGEAPVSHGNAANAPSGGDILSSSGGSADFLDDFLSAPTTTNSPNELIPEDPLESGNPFSGGHDFIPEDIDFGSGAPATTQENHTPGAKDHFRPPASHSSQIPDDWDDDLTGDEHVPAKTTKQPAPTTKVAQAPDQVPPPAAAVANDVAARAFLKAAGVEHLNISDEDLETSLSQLGDVMQTLITGIREVLMTRAAIKSEFRMGQTTIGSTNNNPLKFSISAEQALEAMAKPTSRGYLDPRTAAQQALEDIKAHEVAMISGMEAALKGVLKKLDPAELTGQIETSGAIGSLLKGKKARYWEVYEKIYVDISGQAEDDFQELFSKEFARAYQDQLKKL